MDARFANENEHFSLRAAALIVEKDQILLAKSNRYDCFYTVGGGINQNEASDTAILRECYEETGHHFEIDRLVFVQERFFALDNVPHHEVTFFYLMKRSGFELQSGAATDQSNEHLFWIPIKELGTTNVTPSFLRKELKAIPTHVVHIISYE